MSPSVGEVVLSRIDNCGAEGGRTKLGHYGVGGHLPRLLVSILRLLIVVQELLHDVYRYLFHCDSDHGIHTSDKDMERRGRFEDPSDLLGTIVRAVGGRNYALDE